MVLGLRGLGFRVVGQGLGSSNIACSVQFMDRLYKSFL